MKRLLAPLCLALALPASGGAQGLAFPGPATAMGERSAALADFDVPVGPWRNGEIETIAAEGQFSQTAWQVAATDIGTIDLMVSLRKQIEAEGYEVLFECRTRSCGGFDFRFALDVLPEPEMHVDLGDFRFLSARRGTGDATEYLSLLVSHSSGTGFVQVTHVAPPEGAGFAPVLSTRSPTAFAPTTFAAATLGAGPDFIGPLPQALEEGGAIPLDDLAFGTGAAALAPGRFVSLEALAAYLLENPSRKVTLVGHSDAAGGLAGNISLSRQRASAVMEALARDYGVPRAQLDAEGVGFLAPRASNLTDDGRTLNRRVEAILTAKE